MRNTTKAVLYVFIGVFTSIALLIGVVYLLLSGTFLPVYVGKTYVIGNQILRYLLYAVLFIGIILSAK